jgi:glycosyl transferase family 25
MKSINNQHNKKHNKQQEDPFTKYIDRIFYINLNRRQDRREQMETQLKEYNINVERFEAIEHTDGIVGCTKSHLEVLKLAKKRNYQTILILEDDFEFQLSPDHLREQINKLFLMNVKFDVCMLGYKLINGEFTKYPFLKKAIEAQSASAYIVTNPFYQKIIDLYEEAIPLLETTGEHWNYANDQVWKKIQPMTNWYCIEPRAGKQRNGYSDNAESYIEYDC